MPFTSWKDFDEFQIEARFENRFVYSESVNQFIESVTETLPRRRKVLLDQTILYRSQLGCEEFEEGGELIITGHPVERMTPLPKKAREGRANPKGIPYLYLSNDENTSLAELRPHKGQQISCAQFKATRELQIIDCYSVEKHIGITECIFNPPESSEDIESAIWSMINDTFSRPTTEGEDHSSYVPTQILAEIFKSNGYDGICYNSSLGAGYNIVLFNLDAAKLINCTVMDTRQINYDFAECTNRYFVEE